MTKFAFVQTDFPMRGPRRDKTNWAVETFSLTPMVTLW